MHEWVNGALSVKHINTNKDYLIKEHPQGKVFLCSFNNRTANTTDHKYLTPWHTFQKPTP